MVSELNSGQDCDGPLEESTVDKSCIFKLLRLRALLSNIWRENHRLTN